MGWDKAVQHHLNCRDNISSYISGTDYDLSEIKGLKYDNQCELGKWLYYSYEFYKSDKDFIHLIDSHKSFHDVACDMITCIRFDKFNNSDINKLLLTYLKLSDQVLDSISLLRSKYTQ